MDIAHLIHHPEEMDKETLYDLRKLVAHYPYYQTARLLMLQNLYLLHDPAFNEELRKAAVYVTDRKVIFNMVEATHYQVRKTGVRQQVASASSRADRTLSLIDSFLDTIPVEEDIKEKRKRKPTPADAAIDYVSFLIDSEDEEETVTAPQMKGQALIDNFISNGSGRIELKETPEYTPELENEQTGTQPSNESYFTETLARIYIQQGKFEKALEIITRLYLNYPKKNAYFADQIRFLEKLVLNSSMGNAEKTK